MINMPGPRKITPISEVYLWKNQLWVLGRTYAWSLYRFYSSKSASLKGIESVKKDFPQSAKMKSFRTLNGYAVFQLVKKEYRTLAISIKLDGKLLDTKAKIKKYDLRKPRRK